ncbi:MAG: Na(+)-translocating NADH-quinone reductase subunit C [Deltaproteobacteria bacterium]|nr:Na(+)-translocating NADH-quinone reductase subunit C [Deltaproteobacteria bacterium]
MQKDSVIGTLVTALVVCVVCSLLVSGSAVSLKEKQQANKKLDIKKNLLLASGLITEQEATAENIERAFADIDAQVIELATGEPAPDLSANTFDQRKAAKNPEQNKQIDPKADSARIKQRSKYSIVYQVKDNGQTQMYIFPVHGKGLWSTLYGFIALASDLQTVEGIGFYEHKETAGLGGEVDNPDWKASWKGKKIYDDQFEVELQVIKGKVSPQDKNADVKIDGLSGATITSNGVTGLVRYWFGPDGFGPYIEKARTAEVPAQ